MTDVDDDRGYEEDAGKEASCWPVVFERPLTQLERRWWRRFRNPRLLPTLPPGCVYVFTAAGQQQTCRDGGKLRGDEPMLVDAAWVSAVSMRFRRIAIWSRYPTTNPAIFFTVGVWFGCQVEDPAAAAANGPFDPRLELTNQLRCTLAGVDGLGRYDPADLAAARTSTVQALTAEYGANPPRLPGMRITFASAVLESPRDLRRHQAELRDTEWRRLEHQVKHAAERERVEDTERDLLGSPERSEATAVARGQRTADQAASRQFEDRHAQLDRLAAQVKDWLDSDQARRAPIDRRELAEALFSRLLDRPAPPSAGSRTGLVEPRENAGNGRAQHEVLSRVVPTPLDDDL